MSKLNDIEQIKGKCFKFAVANGTSKELLNSNKLPSNTIIISSPLNDNGEDNGSPIMAITDYNSTPSILTKQILTTNGIVNDKNDDYLELKIDNNTIIENSDNQLSVNINNIVDNNTLTINDNGKITVNTSNLDHASQDTIGVLKIDNYSIKNNLDEKLYVDTDNIDKCSNDLYGIAQADGKTIIGVNGIFNVNTGNLEKGNKLSSGIVKADEKTITCNDGVLSVITKGIRLADTNVYGIARADNKTLKTQNGIFFVNNLPKATMDSFGLIKPDEKTITSNDGVINVFNYDNILNDFNYIEEEIKKLKNTTISANNVKETTNPKIYTFMCNTISSAVLTRPEYGLFENDFTPEDISIELIVNTNCMFELHIDIDNNISPEISVKYIIYDGVKYYGDSYKTTKFSSTNSKNIPMKVCLSCKNYASNINTETEIANVCLHINYMFNTNITLSTIFSIVRYNSLYLSDTSSDPVIISNKDLHVIQNIQIVGKEQYYKVVHQK